MAEKAVKELSEVEQIYKDIRARVSRRYKKRAEFFGQAGAYLITVGFFWAVLQPNDGFWWWMGMIITFGWLIGLVIQGVEWFFSELQERAIQQEFERITGLQGLVNKRKNDAMMNDYAQMQRLAMIDDDGELIYQDELDQESQQR